MNTKYPRAHAVPRYQAGSMTSMCSMTTQTKISVQAKVFELCSQWEYACRTFLCDQIIVRTRKSWTPPLRVRGDLTNRDYCTPNTIYSQGSAEAAFRPFIIHSVRWMAAPSTF